MSNILARTRGYGKFVLFVSSLMNNLASSSLYPEMVWDEEMERLAAVLNHATGGDNERGAKYFRTLPLGPSSQLGLCIRDGPERTMN